MRRISDDRAVIVTPTSLEIAAVELRSSEFGPLIGDRKDVVVTAERLVFDAPIVASGASMRILAHELVGGANARIDVSGVDGRDAPRTPKPKPALGRRSANLDGENGGPAGAGGRVEILASVLEGRLEIAARGGEGGSPQPGGDGADGVPGRRGRDPRNVMDGQGEPGGDGGPAGAAGKAGAPGPSGDGGRIVIFLAEGREGLTTDVDGGPKPPATRHGAPGVPGAPGRGGRRTFCRMSHGMCFR